jgi:hypothetical protein
LLKSRLQGQHFETRDDHFAALIELTGTSEKRIWERVFLEWREGLEKYISTDGEYVRGDEYQGKRWECSSWEESRC